LQEALRSLEKYGKLHGAEFGRLLEALRYRAYTVEKAILAAPLASFSVTRDSTCWQPAPIASARSSTRLLMPRLAPWTS
jgi:hypothetical protein